MANEIRIKSPSTQLNRGEPVTIPITVVLDRPLKVRGIHAEFKGAEETKADYTTTTTDGKGHTTTQTHTAVQLVDVTTQVHLVAGKERLGLFGNLSDAVATIFGAGVHDKMEPGEYDFEVEVVIPEHAPPTHVGKKTRVFYELSVEVDVPLAFDLKALHSFDVSPLPVEYQTSPVRTRYPDDTGRGLIDSLFAPDVQIEMALVANTYRLGESIKGLFCLEAAKPMKCKAVRVRLIGVETSKADGHTDRHVHKGPAVELEGVPAVLMGSYKHEFNIDAATEAPLSANGELFSIEWFVQVELDVPWAKDPRIRAPIQLLPAGATA